MATEQSYKSASSQNLAEHKTLLNAASYLLFALGFGTWMLDLEFRTLVWACLPEPD